MSSPLYDVGLQPERTQLAWRRTSLAIAVGSVVSLRILPALADTAVWFAPGGVGLAFAGWIWWVAHRRYRRFNAQVRATGYPTSSGGASLAAIAVFASLLGVAALVVVIAEIVVDQG